MMWLKFFRFHSCVKSYLKDIKTLDRQCAVHKNLTFIENMILTKKANFGR